MLYQYIAEERGQLSKGCHSEELHLDMEVGAEVRSVLGSFRADLSEGHRIIHRYHFHPPAPRGSREPSYAPAGAPPTSGCGTSGSTRDSTAHRGTRAHLARYVMLAEIYNVT